MARRRLAALAAPAEKAEPRKTTALRKRLERSERRATSLATDGLLGSNAPAMPPPVTDPERLEVEWSSAPTISQWISRMWQGEIGWPEIVAIQKNAELGMVDQWADFTRRMYKSDDTILSTMMTYVGAVSGARREVAPREGIPSLLAEVAADQAQACSMLLDNLPDVEQTIAEMIDADFVGYSGHEIIWRPIGEWIYPTELRWLHPDRFRFSQHFEPFLYDRGLAASRGGELHVNMDAADGMGIPLVGNKYIVHMPRLIPDYPQGSGLLYGCVRYWFVKNWCTKFALSGAESAGVPRMLGKVLNAAPELVREALFTALAGLSAEGVGVIGEGTEVSILDPKMQGNGSVWDFLLKRCDAGLTKAILGSTLNVEVSDTGGNRALGESQASVTISPRWQRSGKLVANALERQLFRPFLEMNRSVWGGHVFVPNLTFHIVEDEPEVDEVAVDSGVVTVDELRRSRKLPAWGKERGGDKIVVRASRSMSLDASSVPGGGLQPVAAPDALGAPTLPSGDEVATGETAEAAVSVAETALNGAQVKSLMDMLAAVSDGTLVPAAATIAIRNAFPSISPPEVAEMVSAQAASRRSAPALPSDASPRGDTEAEPTPGGGDAASPFPSSRRSRMSAALRATPSRRS